MAELLPPRLAPPNPSGKTRRFADPPLARHAAVPCVPEPPPCAIASLFATPSRGPDPLDLIATTRRHLPIRRTVRIGITGLARAGKTALLTSLAANLQTRPDLHVRPAPAGAGSLPRFNVQTHLAALAADPPHWPARTDSVSLLALDIDRPRPPWPTRRIRLELLDYPGEWLLDLPLLAQSFPAWSAATLRRLEPRPEARAFLAFVHGLPAATADEALATEGAALYRALLRTLRDAGLSTLQPGRLLMPPPGAEPPWMTLFPHSGSGPLAALLARRYDAYCAAVRRDLVAPGFGQVDRIVVLADLLTALHAGEAAFTDTAAALAAVATALRWRRPPGFLPAWLAGLLPFGGIARVAFAATKSDHVADRQRRNLAALMDSLVTTGPAAAPSFAARSFAAHAFAIAAMRCTEDFVWTLEGRPVSAVRGRVAGHGLVGSYPGEVPDRTPGPEFWGHPFLHIPDFEPLRLPARGMPNLNLDALLAFLLDDVL
jgi:hypothetical protein